MKQTQTVLNFPRDNFDQDNTFSFAYKGFKGERTGKGYLFADGEDIYIMQSGACLKDSYTAKDREETHRLNTMEPIRTGDIVIVNGREYEVKILGNYSDAGRLIPV